MRKVRKRLISAALLSALCLLLNACARTTGGAVLDSSEAAPQAEASQTEAPLNMATVLTETPLHAVWEWSSAAETDTDTASAPDSAGDRLLRELLYGDVTTVRSAGSAEADGWNMSVLASEPEVTEEADGTRSVTISLQTELCWSDGEPLTAEDYVMAYALFSQGDISETAYFEDISARLSGSCFLGYGEYRGSTAAEQVEVSTADIIPFAGVRLLDEYRFCCTIAEEYADVPLTELLAMCPHPAHIWLPQDVHVLDDGSGVFLSSAARAARMTQHFTEAAAQNGGYISAGAYYVESWDEEGQEVVLCRNPYSPAVPTGILSGDDYERLVLRCTEAMREQARQMEGEVYLLEEAGTLELYEPETAEAENGMNTEAGMAE